jgi:hypothetical protein
MPTRREHGWTGAVAIAAAIAWASACAAPDRPAPAPPRFEGVTLTRYQGAAVAMRVRAEEVLVIPKRLGVLELGSVGELVLGRARVEVFERSAEPDGDGGAPGPAGAGAEASPDAAAADQAPSRGAAAAQPAADATAQSTPGLSFVRAAAPGILGAPPIGGVTLYALEYVLVRDGVPALRIEAKQGVVDLRRGDLGLRDARIEHLPSGRRVTAARATWRPRAREVVIRGEYLLTADGATTRGGGARLDAELRPAPERGAPAVTRPGPRRHE